MEIFGFVIGFFILAFLSFGWFVLILLLGAWSTPKKGELLIVFIYAVLICGSWVLLFSNSPFSITVSN